LGGSFDQADDASALLVIDVQNCFLPGGSLAVKDGEQVVPVINRIAKGFANVVMTQDWHTPAMSHSRRPCRQKAVRDRRSQIRQAGAVARSLRAGNRRRLAFEGPLDPAGRAHHSKGFPQGRRQLFGLHRGRRQDHDRTCRLPQGAQDKRVFVAGLAKRLFVAGLATDFCVAWTALDARKAGFETYVVEDACRGIDTQGSLAKAWADMAKAGVKRIQSGDIAV
jgi:nicotinamidase/pyrazinamidase